MEEPEWTSATKQKFRARLLAWFRRQARDLPWRRTRDIYRVWISEIMLQQTQVATVVPYYERFVARFPTITALAAADEQEVLRYWEGLGYYRRARQLHAAARTIEAKHGGQFPTAFADVLALPGIGRYSAGAILSIARDEPWPVVEANTTRLFSRLLLYQADPTTATAQRRFWDFATRLLPRRHVGAYNQAVMELGSEICLPRQPRCPLCPIQTCCPTSARGWQHRIPATVKKTKYQDVTEVAVVVFDRPAGNRLLLRRCGSGERWAGLWDFPRFSVPGESLQSEEWTRELEEQTRRVVGIPVRVKSHFGTLKHGVTRYRITLQCYLATAEPASPLPGTPEVCWVTRLDLKSYPLNATGRRISNLIGGLVTT